MSQFEEIEALVRIPRWEDPAVIASLTCSTGKFLQARQATPGPGPAPATSLITVDPALRLVAAVHSEAKGAFYLLTTEGAQTSIKVLNSSGDVSDDFYLPDVVRPSCLAFYDPKRDDSFIIAGDGFLRHFDLRSRRIVLSLEADTPSPLDVVALHNGGHAYHDEASLFFMTPEETRKSDVAAGMRCSEPIGHGALAAGFEDRLFLLTCSGAAVFNDVLDFEGYVSVEGRSVTADPCGNLVTIHPASRVWRVYDNTPGYPLGGAGEYAPDVTVGDEGAFAAPGERALRLTSEGKLLLASHRGVSAV